MVPLIRTKEKMEVKEKYYLKTLGNAFEVLDEISLRKVPVGIAELSVKFDLPKSKVHRIVDTLKFWGYLEQEPSTRKYFLGTKVLELCKNKLDSMDLVQVVIPYLEELVEQVGETVHFGILDAGKVLYLVKKQAPHAMGIISKVGQKLNAHCSGIGKVLLSHLDEPILDKIIENVGLPRYTKNTITNPRDLKQELTKIRIQGYGEDNEEICEGLHCIAAPIRNYIGNLAGAISVSIPTVRLTEERKEDIKRMILAQSEKISTRLGYVSNKNPIQGDSHELQEGL